MNYRRFAVVALAGVLPWVLVTWDTGWYPIFSVGFANISSFPFASSSFTTLPAYLGRVGTVPSHLSAWPLATLLYAIALASAVFEKADSVVVAGFLGLAAFNVGLLAVAVSGQRGIIAFPVGALWLPLAAGWVVYADLTVG